MRMFWSKINMPSSRIIAITSQVHQHLIFQRQLHFTFKLSGLLTVIHANDVECNNQHLEQPTKLWCLHCALVPLISQHLFIQPEIRSHGNMALHQGCSMYKPPFAFSLFDIDSARCWKRSSKISVMFKEPV